MSTQKYFIYSYTLLFLSILFFQFGCTTKDQIESEQIIEINFEDKTESKQTKIINTPTIIKLFVDISDYDTDEILKDTQEYHNLSDFQGYYGHITPLIDSLKINSISLEEKNVELNFKTQNGDFYTLEPLKLPAKQGLILFNGRNKPIFWKGNDYDKLDIFITEYFK